MKRHIIVASHSKMADGLKDTINFVLGGVDHLISISAYLDNKPITEKIEEVMTPFSSEDEVIILTDMTGGSVNQNFFPYRNRLHTHIISGMNLPLAIALAMQPTDDYLTMDEIRNIVESAKNEIKYINDIVDDEDEEDE